MEIKINTNEILGNEEAVKTEIFDLILRAFREDLNEKVTQTIDFIIKEELTASLKTEMAKEVRRIVDESLDYEYEEVSAYGSKEGKFTIRNRIAEIFKEQAVFKKASYNSDKNAFTLAVEAAISEEVKTAKVDFNKVIDYQFLSEMQEYAIEKIKSRLKI